MSHSSRFRASSFLRISSFVVRYFLLLSLVSASAQEPRAETFKDIAQDGEGVIWAINTKLFFFDGRDWTPVPFPFATDDKTNVQGEALALTRMQDGGMTCVWRLAKDAMAVTRHTSTDSRLLGQCAVKLNYTALKSRPFADSRNRLWIIDEKPDVYRADAAGGLKLVYSIKPEQLIDPKATCAFTGALYACEDGHGRIWIWANSWSVSGTTSNALRGFLLFDGDNVKQLDSIDGLAGKRLSYVDREDDKHLWVAVAMEGIFELDIDTLKTTHLPEAEPGAFRWVKKVFTVGDDLFVVANSGQDTFRNCVWRRRDGKWSKMIDNLDANTGSSLNITPTILPFGKDFLLSTYGSAPWYFSPDAPPARLDWQSGFPAEDAWKVFRLTDGSLVALDGARHPVHGTATIPPKPPGSHVTEIRFKHSWGIDANGNVWTVLSGKENILCQWDGARWIEHPFPHEIKGMSPQKIVADTSGRIWLLPVPGALFDSHAGKWGLFPSLGEEFESVKNDPPQFVGDRPAYSAPDYSADRKRIAYRVETGDLAYFDGANWQTFKPADIQPSEGNRSPVMLGPPFFSKSDHLSVNINSVTWEFDDHGAWRKKDLEIKFPDRWGDNQAQPKVLNHETIVLPPDRFPSIPNTFRWDNQDACWFTAQRKLYKYAYGTLVEIFAKDEPNPFIDGRQIKSAWVDPRGNAFLQTGFEKLVMIAPGSPLLKTSLSVEKGEGDSATAQFAADPPSQIQFRWKLDDGPWKLTKEKTITLDSLPNGPHALTVAAVDAALQASPPAVAKFEIKIDPEKQIATLIQQLSDPDFAKRKSAVAALALQPVAALPALKSAREKAPDDLRWWIDVAIQEIGNPPAKPQPSPSN